MVAADGTVYVTWFEALLAPVSMHLTSFRGSNGQQLFDVETLTVSSYRHAGAPVLGASEIYIGTGLTAVVALASPIPFTGILWQVALPEGFVITSELSLFPPAECVYFGTNTGQLCSVSYQTRSLAWCQSLTPGQQIQSPITVGPDFSLYVIGNNNRLYSLDSAGTTRWVFGASSPDPSSNTGIAPVLSPNGLVYYAIGTTLYAVDSNTGYSRW